MDQLLNSFGCLSIDSTLDKFNKLNSQWSHEFALSESIERKQKLMDIIFTHLRDPSYKSHFDVFLCTLRILAREKNGLETLFTAERVETILELAQLTGKCSMVIGDKDSFNAKVINEAQKCLCNLVFNSIAIGRILCRYGVIDGIMLRLKMFREPGLPIEVKYFDLRIMFIITALCAELRPKIRDEHHGFVYLMEAIDVMLKEAEEPGQQPSRKSQRKRKVKDSNSKNVTSKSESTGQKAGGESSSSTTSQFFNSALVDLCCEALKVLFNLTVAYERGNIDEEEEAHFLRLVGILHDLLLTDCETKEKRRELLTHTVNLLTNVPPSCFEELLVSIEEIGHIDNPKYEYEAMNVEAIVVLLEFLDKRLEKDPSKNIHESLSPILTCLTSMAQASRIIRKYLRQQILPPLTRKDVQKRPEEGNSIRNRLVKLMTNSNTDIKEMVGGFLFVLCKENAQRMIKYAGYGNCAGFFANRGLLLAGKTNTSYSSDSEDSDTEEYSKLKEKINPVTGCYEPLKVNPMEGMTEEQKEHEAMKLVNMMDRLSRAGVVQPCRVGNDGKPQPISHLLELQEAMDDNPKEQKE
ncbi:ric8 guanine nucleotide exchange factor A isoform X2 [Brevipalpus obovatus]|uniref:ric8 guanine nucleotide exchange factor A isoform X2 n=1 Tax=Brevipalpus obovatus TaxID=246614 RepID=UPI003D9E6F50